MIEASTGARENGLTTARSSTTAPTNEMTSVAAKAVQ